MKQVEYLLIGDQYEMLPNPLGERKSRRVIKKFLARNKEEAERISKSRYNYVINSELYQRVE